MSINQGGNFTTNQGVGATAQPGSTVQEHGAGLGHSVQGHHAPRDGFDQGEHGSGTGASGGHGTAHSGNTQSGGGDSFNSGLGAEHASGALPKHTPTPIADSFTVTDLLTDAGLAALNSWLTTRSYIAGYSPSQADVVTFKALKESPPVAKYPHAFRWYKHVSSYSSEFSSLPGDPSKEYTSYGPEVSQVTINPKNAPEKAEEEDDDDDLFGSDDDEEEDPEVVRKREENLAAYRKKKEGKTKPAAKSIVTLDVKPWDDETDMAELEANVLKIEMDGLVWSKGALIPVGFGIKKFQINVVVEDEKVSIDDLQAKIEEDEEHVQSTDVAAMQKL